MVKILRKTTVLCLAALALVLLLAACSSPTGPKNYNVAGAAADIPTITSIVGDRNLVGSSVTRYAKAEEGNLSVTCAYSGAPDAADDIQRYCHTLTADGSFALKMPLGDGTTAILEAASTIAGQHIQIIATMTDSSSYTITTEVVKDGDDSSSAT